MYKLNINDKFLCSVVIVTPSTQELEHINIQLPFVENWDNMMLRLIRQGFAPLMYIKLPLLTNANGIPPAVTKKLKDAYYKTTSRSLLLQQAFADCVQLFNANNIDVIVLKGIYLSEYLYQNPALRLMSDIDILVKVEDGPTCVALLKEMGYEFRALEADESETAIHDMDLDSGPIHYCQLLKNNISIEIHIKLQNETEKYEFPIDKIWRNAQKINLYNQEVYTLEFYDLLIHLCLHLKKHFVDMEHVQFSSFADIVNLLCRIDNRQQTTVDRKKENGLPPTPKGEQERKKNKEVSLTNLEDFEWEVLEQRAAEYKCTEIVFGFIALVNKYFSAPVPAERVENYRKYLSKYDEKLFLGYLQSDTSNFVKNKSAVRTHFRNMLHLSNGSALHYLFRTIFPDKEFLVKKYGLGKVGSQQLAVSSKADNDCKLNTVNCKLKFWWLWYPYRWAIGVKEFLKLVLKGRR